MAQCSTQDGESLKEMVMVQCQTPKRGKMRQSRNKRSLILQSDRSGEGKACIEDKERERLFTLPALKYYTERLRE